MSPNYISLIILSFFYGLFVVGLSGDHWHRWSYGQIGLVCLLAGPVGWFIILVWSIAWCYKRFWKILGSFGKKQ